MQFLDQVEVNAQWQNYPTNTLKVFPQRRIRNYVR